MEIQSFQLIHSTARFPKRLGAVTDLEGGKGAFGGHIDFMFFPPPLRPAAGSATGRSLCGEV